MSAENFNQTTLDLPPVRGTYRFNADLSKTNWFRVGGKAQVLFLPKDRADLVSFLTHKSSDLPITLLGVGSNVIICDGGVEGVVIKLGGDFTKISHKDNLVNIGGSCLCYNASLYCRINGLSGLEFLAGVPGSIGGAIAMNAGCYNGDIASALVSATALDFNGKVLQLNNKDFGFTYRGNSLQKNLIFIEGIFKIEKSTPEAVGHKIAEFNRKRETTQPIRTKTSGSTFKNPPGDKKAWQLIDEAGCRGIKVGDAQISEQHCNFMINTGNATAKDLINLGNLVIDKVKEKSGIVLEWEIKIIGRH
jgi:UDP-N-acetylmuramate dehydrogenase